MIKIIFLLFHCFVFSKTIYQNLIDSKSINEMNRALSDWGTDQEVNSLCEYQIKDRKIPFACFKTKLPEHSVEDIDKTCSDKISEIDNLNQLKKIITYIPNRSLCAEIAAKRMRRLRYIKLNE